MRFEDMLPSLKNSSIDVGICAVYVAPERISNFDYTVPYITSGYRMVVAVTKQSVSGLQVFQRAFRIPSAWAAWAFLSVLTCSVIFSHIFWALERPHNLNIRKDYGPGIFDAWWFSVVSALTVGFGDKIPRTVLGKMLTVLWFFFTMHSILLIGAAITSDFLAHDTNLDFGIKGLQDLTKYKSIGATHKKAKDFLEMGFENLTDWKGKVDWEEGDLWLESYEGLKDDKYKIIIDDMLSAQYTLGKNASFRENFILVGPVLGRLQAAFAISRPNGTQHPCFEVINRAVVEYVAGERRILLDQLVQTWFGIIKSSQASASYESALQSVLEDWNEQYTLGVTVFVLGWSVCVLLHYRREIKEARMKSAILQGMGLGQKFSREELAKGSEMLFERMDEDKSGKVNLTEIATVLQKLSSKLNHRHIEQVVTEMQEHNKASMEDATQSGSSIFGVVSTKSLMRPFANTESARRITSQTDLDLAEFQQLMDIIFFRAFDGAERLSAPAKRIHAQQTHLDFKHNAWKTFARMMGRIDDLEQEILPHLKGRIDSATPDSVVNSAQVGVPEEPKTEYLN